MEDARVRRLEERDIDAAIALTDLERWGYMRADFERLLSLSPDGCFAADLDGRVVGVLTTTSYHRLAFLGAVIVSPQLRGKGVGKQMMKAALAHLRKAGVTTVRLNAYLTAVRFYERLGFHGEYEVARWRGRATAGEARGIRRVRPRDMDGLARLDAKYFGASRRRLLDRLREEFSETFLVAERSGRLRGFIVGSTGGNSCEIGPWVAEPASPEIARDLHRGLVAAAGVSEVALSGPLTNAALRDFVRDLRFDEEFRALRMYWGANDFPGDPEGIWALGGLEKG